MNKTLILMRHGESNIGNIKDILRNLSPAGIQEALISAQFLEKENLIPDYILSSAAVRCKKTALAVSEYLSIPKEKIITDSKLYLSSPKTVLNSLANFEHQQANIILVVAHNPGLLGLTLELNRRAGQTKINNFPTCGTAIFEIKSIDWKSIDANNSIMKFFTYPRKETGI